MTEAEWQICEDTEQMLMFYLGIIGDRKRRLFAVACCRSVWPLFRDDRCRNAVEVAERFADKRANARELKLAQIATEEVRSTEDPLWGAAWSSASNKAIDASWESQRETTLHVGKEQTSKQLVLLRCIFGNPFRPVTLNPTWLTSPVHTLANDIYEEKAFDRMPFLADALQDASCDNKDILNHCRQLGEHARGCWVVDLILSKC